MNSVAKNIKPAKNFEYYNNIFMHFCIWAKSKKLSRKLSYLLVFLSLVSGIATYFAFSLPNGPNTHVVQMLLYLDLGLLLCLFIMLGKGILKVWYEKKQGSIGSGLHVRFVLLFLIITAMPTILVSAFFAVFFSIGMQAWFGDQVYNAVKESSNVAEAYFKEHTNNIASEIYGVMYSIDMVRMNKEQLENLLNNKLISRGVDEAIIFDVSGKIQAKAGYTFTLSSETVPFGALEQADSGEVVVTVGEKNDWVKALAKIPNSIFYIYIGRMVDPSVIGHIERANIAVKNYETLEGERSMLELTSTGIFMIVSMLLMMVSAWIGMIFASRLSTPIVNLIDASDKVRKGDFSIRVKEHAYKDELSILTRAFNKMMDEISRTNKELDERMSFIETVLSGVSVGVIGTDNQAKIRILNKTATDLFCKTASECKGKSIIEIIPQTKKIIDKIKNSKHKLVSEEIQIYQAGTIRILQVRVVGDYSTDNILEGFVFTFDDITDLQSAQRKAAWADVARRIAHEIKNPLTPIQLAAERLKRKYQSKLDDTTGEFAICTDTIVRHVSDIGQMVDEFSSFARMPAPVMKQQDIKKIVRESVFLQKTAHPDIEFCLNLPDDSIFLNVDNSQLTQVMTNIIKNAVESIDEVHSTDKKGQITVTLTQNISPHNAGIVLSIADNGKGLPTGDKLNTITEPYVTTKAKGTGLGLAIVKKIMEDHKGILKIENQSNNMGAVITLIFPNNQTNKV